MRLVADREVCIGSGSCVLTAPTVFDQDDDAGLVLLLTTAPGAQDADAVREAVAHCPSGALRLIDGRDAAAG